MDAESSVSCPGEVSPLPMLQFLRRYSNMTVAFVTLVHRIGDARNHPGFAHGCFEIEIRQGRLLVGISAELFLL